MAKKNTSTKGENLQKAIDKLNKTYGQGTIMKLGDAPVSDIPSIDSGSISLNQALGVGGYPRGRIVEIMGVESSGKSSMAIHAAAALQKSGSVAAFVDAEHAFDRDYAKNLGVNVDELYFSQPKNGEEALETVDQLIRSGEIGLVVIDSVAALVPKSELEGEMGDTKMGLHARLMSQAMRKLSGNISKTNTCCIFINQYRQDIGKMFGPSEVGTGGNALKFYASVRLDVRRIGQVKDGEQIVGSKTRVKVVKNKVAPPFRKAEFDIMYGEGISRAAELIDLGVQYGVIKQNGSWYSYGETKLGQGKETVRFLLKDNEELAEEIEKKILDKMS
jgi:recombination protein RecA